MHLRSPPHLHRSNLHTPRLGSLQQHCRTSANAYYLCRTFVAQHSSHARYFIVEQHLIAYWSKGLTAASPLASRSQVATASPQATRCHIDAIAYSLQHRKHTLAVASLPRRRRTLAAASLSHPRSRIAAASPQHVSSRITAPVTASPPHPYNSNYSIANDRFAIASPQHDSSCLVAAR